jgi:hypothetical protein
MPKQAEVKTGVQNRTIKTLALYRVAKINREFIDAEKRTGAAIPFDWLPLYSLFYFFRINFAILLASLSAYKDTDNVKIVINERINKAVYLFIFRSS